MDLKILPWNVEHFSGHGTGAREDRIADVAALIAALIKDENPDIFALKEVDGSTVFQAFTAAFPGLIGLPGLASPGYKLRSHVQQWVWEQLSVGRSGSRLRN